jgi:hypothetical protein
MSKCKKQIRPAVNGASRGFCAKQKGHKSLCGNSTCVNCGIHLTKNNRNHNKNWLHICSDCFRIRYRKYNRTQRDRLGSKPQNCGTANTSHTFSCGCSGVLPDIGKSNAFAVRASKTKSQWSCRIAKVLAASQFAAARKNHVPINLKTPHHIIRDMMDNPCVHCREPINWKILGMGKTPHLDHDHDTGEINGFSHSKCNPHAMRHEIERLKEEIKKLKQKLGVFNE